METVVNVAMWLIKRRVNLLTYQPTNEAIVARHLYLNVTLVMG